MTYDGFADINCTITILKNGDETPTDITANVYNYSEATLSRNINYTKTVGGVILPRNEKSTSKEVSFDYITNDASFDLLVDENVNTINQDWDTFDEYKIVLTFSNDNGDTYYKAFYNCIITSYETKLNNGVLEGNIAFTLPMKNINGDSNYMVGTTLNLSSYDATMGYD